MRFGSAMVAAAVWGMAGCACAAVIPVTAGDATGSGPTGLSGAMFDNQPPAEPTPGLVTDPLYSGGSYGSWWSTDRAIYIDFGPDYANLSISGAYEMWRQWGSSPTGDLLSYWWSPDKNMAFDDTAGDVAAPQFGFQDPAKFPNVGNGPVWVKTYNGSAVTPAAQYLIIHVGNGTTITDGSKEWAFIGTTVPEPASLGLIGLMALALNRRRHNS